MHDIEIITAQPGNQLAQELEAIQAEHHSQSSQDIQASLQIYVKTEIGFGTIYTLVPKAKNQNDAEKTAAELYRRTPFLLSAIFQTIKNKKQKTRIDIPKNGQITTSKHTPKSAHKKFRDHPILIQWLTEQK